MPLAGLAQPAVGVERPAQGIGGGQVVNGTVDGVNRQALPCVRIVPGPGRVGQFHRGAVHPLEGGVGQLGAGLGDRAAMDRLRLGPQPAAVGLAEERARLAVHALARAAGRQRQQKDEKDREREFPLPDKRLRRCLDAFRGKAGGDQIEERVEKGGKLA